MQKCREIVRLVDALLGVAHGWGNESFDGHVIEFATETYDNVRLGHHFGLPSLSL
eukprot:SAG31_NODE_4115_length_3570_cov_35.497551_2_plen_55_part_00